MRFQFFAVPALFPEAAQTELNQFLARHRVAQMESRLVEAGAESYWTVAVRYFENHHVFRLAEPEVYDSATT